MKKMRLSNSHKSSNFLHLLQNRELQENDWRLFSKKSHIFPSTIARLDLAEELEGHFGCVNCLEFNQAGDLLLSGSDDFSVILWDVHRRKLISSFQTGHRGNIFSVKFLPQTNDNVIITGAGDHRIEVREITSGERLHACTCHSERVKRIATISSSPSLFFSASEDGTVMQYDTREKHSCSSHPSVLINLKHHSGRLAECKCVAVHPIRPELLAVGASDPYIRIYDRRMINLTTVQNSGSTWDRRNFSSRQVVESSPDNLPLGCVQYFVPGHLPAKMKEYQRKYRSLATTFLSYSNDGNHLLANLGGDHVYLFDTENSEVPKEYSKLFKLTKYVDSNDECAMRDVSNGHSRHSLSIHDDDLSQPPFEPIPSRAESLRQQAHLAFNAQEYTKALELYNLAILAYDNIALLYSARAATLIKRKWDGDVYAALRDCNRAIELDCNNIKAKFRQVRCLHLLGRDEETHQCLGDLLDRYPQLSTSSAWAELKEKISKSCTTTNSTSGSDSEREEDAFLIPPITENERIWRSNAKDYQNVYSGHCNTTTDIKEAVFVGQNEDFIAAGSDDGNLFIWDRHTSNLVRVIEADKSIVNCVQSHPNVSLLATSGIETAVKLWAPSAKEEAVETMENKKVWNITQENQRRMSTDPMEMMFLQMGEFLEGGVLARRRTDYDEADSGFLQNSVQCRQT